MPQFPCPVCGKMWPNTFKMRKCAQSAECISLSLAAQKDNSSADRPPYEWDIAKATSASIAKSEWPKHGVDGAHHAHGGLGSLGVFLINLKDEAGTIVMKQGSSESASEYFCSLLYSALGLSVPAMRVMHEDELAKLVGELAGVSFTTPGAGDALQSGGKQRGAVLMEYCSGGTFKNPSVSTMIADAETAPGLLERLGQLVAADMLVNNFDRTNAIWDHEGNANNVMVDKRPDGSMTVWGIDQAAARIIDNAHETTRVDEYVSKVTAAFKEAVTGDMDGRTTTRLRAFLKKYTGQEIDAEGCSAFHKGMIETGIRIAGFHDLSAMYDKTATAFHDAGWGIPGLDSISIPLLERVAEAIAEAVSVLP